MCSHRRRRFGFTRRGTRADDWPTEADPAGRVACVRTCMRTYVRTYSRACLLRSSFLGIPHGGFLPLSSPRARRAITLPVAYHITYRSRPSNASPKPAARRIFLFTRPMVGDARDRHRDMSARRTAAADGGSCHRDARVGTLRPGDKTPRGRRALIVSNRLSSPPLAILAARPVKGGPARPRECRFPRSLGAAQGLHREVGVRDARSILYFSPARSSSVRGEINPFLLEVPRAAPRVIKSSRGSSPAGRKGWNVRA